MRHEDYPYMKTADKTKYHKEWRDKNREKIREYNRNYNREWRNKNGCNSYGYYERNSKKVIAHQAVYKAIKKGKLKRGRCEVCKSPQTQGHHEDYSKPLEVRWLCALHHKKVHSQLSPSK